MLITHGAIGGKGALQDNEPFKGRYKRGVIRDTFWNIMCPAPSELQSQGWGDVPPVAPEVINILLFQRSRQLQDAPPDHVNAIEVFGGSNSQSCLLFYSSTNLREFYFAQRSI